MYLSLFFQFYVTLKHTNRDKTQKRLVRSYQIPPWITLRRKPHAFILARTYKKYFLSQPTAIWRAPRIRYINVSHKIKYKLRLTRGFVRRFFKIKNKQLYLNYFIKNILTTATKNNVIPTQTLSQIFLPHLLIWGSITYPAYKTTTHNNYLKKWALSKYSYNAFLPDLQPIPYYSRYVHYPNYDYYQFHLKTATSLATMPIISKIRKAYKLPRNFEFDFLTLTTVELRHLHNYNYLWTGITLYFWWAYFNVYNWKYWF